METTTDYPNYQQYTRNFSNMINYIYNQLYNLQGLFVRVSDREELVGGFSQETVLVLGQNLPTVQSYISSASKVTRN